MRHVYVCIACIERVCYSGKNFSLSLFNAVRKKRTKKGDWFFCGTLFETKSWIFKLQKWQFSHWVFCIFFLKKEENLFQFFQMKTWTDSWLIKSSNYISTNQNWDRTSNERTKWYVSSLLARNLNLQTFAIHIFSKFDRICYFLQLLE